MSALSGPGAISVRVETNAAGRAMSVALLSGRPVGIGRLFRGKSPAEAPALASQLFSLCGFSHGAASRLALAAACGKTPTSSELFSIEVGRATEQIAESLRSLALGWPRIDGASELARAAAPLREAMSAARLILAFAARGDALGNRDGLASPAAAILQAAETLGWRQAAPERPAPRSHFAGIMDEAAADDFAPSDAPDALSPADDLAVIEALRRGRERFAAAPTLPDRIVETGAFARHWRGAGRNGAAIASRLAARLVALTEAADLLQRSLRDGDTAGDAWTAVGAVGSGEGYAAVETARGRLYHWVRIDAASGICDYQILAPTEWNFHSAGPFAAALLGARLGAGEAARLRVKRLAAVFDPCVAFQLELVESGHA